MTTICFVCNSAGGNVWTPSGPTPGHSPMSAGGNSVAEQFRSHGFDPPAQNSRAPLCVAHDLGPGVDVDERDRLRRGAGGGVDNHLPANDGQVRPPPCRLIESVALHLRGRRASGGRSQRDEAGEAGAYPHVKVPTASPMPRRDRFQRREAVERLETLLAAMARFAHASEGQLDASARAVVVDEHLPGAQRLGEAHLSPSVGRPDAGHETVAGPVGDCRGLGLVIEGNDDLDWPEDFFLGEAMTGGDIGEQGRGDIMSAVRRAGDNLALGGRRQIGAFRDKSGDDRLLPLGNERSDVEVGVSRADPQGLVARRHPLDDLRP